MKIAPWIIISVLIGLLFLQRECHRCTECTEITKTDTLYIAGDSIPVPYPVITPGKPYPVPYPVPADVDTALILADFFSKVQDKIILADDSSVFVSIEYLVTQNRLKWIKPFIQNRRATTIINNTTIIESVKPRNKIFAGVGVWRSLTSFGLAPSLALLTKKDHLYSFSYDLINKDAYFTLYWKIGK